MVIFGVAFVPIMCINAVSGITALARLRGADFLPVLNQPQRESLAMVFLDVGGYGYLVGWVFGLCLFHFGVCGFGRTGRYLVVSDLGSKGPAVGGSSIK